MERLTFVTKDSEVLFHPEDLPDDEGVTITQLAVAKRFRALETIAERLANREQAEEQGQYGKWIPVSERLPEENGKYLVFLTNPVRNKSDNVFTGWYNVYDKKFETENSLDYVKAWMPLPEPYRGK